MSLWAVHCVADEDNLPINDILFFYQMLQAIFQKGAPSSKIFYYLELDRQTFHMFKASRLHRFSNH